MLNKRLSWYKMHGSRRNIPGEYHHLVFAFYIKTIFDNEFLSHRFLYYNFLKNKISTGYNLRVWESPETISP